MEQTCLIVKPDGVGKKKAGEIIRRFENEGFTLRGLKMLKPTTAQIEGFYEVHKGKPFFGPFMSFMMSGPIVVCVFGADNAVARVREIIGATNSAEAKPGTLRNMFGTDNRRNLVHASDSPETAEYEINYFFREFEIYNFNDDDWVEKRK